MLVRWLVSFSLGVALLSPTSRVLAQPAFPHGSYVAGELLIGPKEGVSDDDLENLYKGHGGQKVKKHSQIKAHHIRVPVNALEAIEAKLRKNPKIGYVEKNFIASPELAPNDPGYPSQWHLSQIAAPGAWDFNAGSSNVVIAVLDSGADTKHPDLSPNLVPGHNFLYNSSNVYDNGSNGGHGTAAAGAAAAAGNNATGVSGVSWRNSIMPLVVVENNYATYANIASAIIYAADNGAKVLSMSLAGTSYSSTLENAVNYAWSKGLVLVASAGNYANNSPTYPGAFTNVIAVTATDQSDKSASFTSFGNWVSVAAPGKSIYTTNLGGGYGYWQGTSFSTPLVAGLAGLVFSANPNLTNTQVVSLIKNNADDLGTLGFDQYFGWGRINAHRTLQATYAAIPAPSVSISSPANGSTVSGVVNVSVSASSSVGITKVELYVDGALRGTDFNSPYSFPWDSTGLSGSHSLVAKGYDALGNITTSATKSVTVSSAAPPPPSDTTPPTVAITSVVKSGKFVTVTVSASDQSGVVKVELYVNGALKATDTAAPWSFKMNAKTLPKGTSSLQAKAYDGAGLSNTSASATTTRR